MTKKKVPAAKPAQAKPAPKRAPRKPASFLTAPDNGDIPTFLRVENRVPLTPAQQTALGERLRASESAGHSDPRRPKGQSDDEWKAVQARLAALAKAEQAQARPELEPTAKPDKKAAARERAAQKEAMMKAGPQPLKKPPKEGSRKRKVYEALIAGGQKAALKEGKRLDLKEGTMHSWFGAWSRQAAAEQVIAPPPSVKAGKRKTPPPPTEPVTDRHPRKDGKRRVYLIDTGPHAQGTVMQEGPEQSVVRWDNGNENTVINTWVADLSKVAHQAPHRS